MGRTFQVMIMSSPSIQLLLIARTSINDIIYRNKQHGTGEEHIHQKILGFRIFSNEIHHYIQCFEA